jgi:UTP:GlnB (protein PII) uridylyltransferase
MTVNLTAIKIEVSCVDKPGLLAAISAAITSADVNISRAQVQTFPGGAQYLRGVFCGFRQKQPRHTQRFPG